MFSALLQLRCVFLKLNSMPTNRKKEKTVRRKTLSLNLLAYHTGSLTYTGFFIGVKLFTKSFKVKIFDDSRE